MDDLCNTKVAWPPVNILEEDLMREMIGCLFIIDFVYSYNHHKTEFSLLKGYYYLPIFPLSSNVKSGAARKRQ